MQIIRCTSKVKNCCKIAKQTDWIGSSVFWHVCRPPGKLSLICRSCRVVSCVQHPLLVVTCTVFGDPAKSACTSLAVIAPIFDPLYFGFRLRLLAGVCHTSETPCICYTQYCRSHCRLCSSSTWSKGHQLAQTGHDWWVGKRENGTTVEACRIDLC